jgi:hypothetical protein
MFEIKLLIFFLGDVLWTLALIKQVKFLICDSCGKFQSDLDDQDLMLATVHYMFFLQINSPVSSFFEKLSVM